MYAALTVICSGRLFSFILLSRIQGVRYGPGRLYLERRTVFGAENDGGQ